MGAKKEKKHTATFFKFPQETSKGSSFLFNPQPLSILEDGDTISGRSSSKKVRQGRSNNKGKIFDQDGSAIDHIEMEPLSLAPPALVP